MKRSREGDRLHLLRMRDAAQLAQRVAINRKRSDLEFDLLLQLGLAKAVELIGESAARVSEDFQLQHTHIPWRRIIGMRHVLVHNYWRVELDVVWDTVISDIPPLIEQLQQLLGSET